MAVYRVNDVYSCVQGEGCQTGVAMVLVRLHGCSVGCPWCDTRETWAVDEAQRVETLPAALGANPRWAEVQAKDLAAYVATCHPGPRWVLLTGGEPANQTLGPLVSAFHTIGLQVALETSGTALGHVGANCDWVCVSPKAGMPGGRSIEPAAVQEADEIKYVIGRQSDLVRLDEFLAAHPLKAGVQVCLQPLSQNRVATELAIRTVQERGWRLSSQTHKYLGLR